MRVQQFDNPANFAAAATPLLLRDEAENCFILGLLASPGDLAGALLCAVHDGGACVAAATMTPGRHLVITRAPAGAAVALARHLHVNAVALPGIGGVRETAETFAREWVGLTGVHTHVHVEMALHQLTRVTPPRPAPGRMRVAELRDLDVVAQWATAFHAEIGAVHVRDGRDTARRRVPTGNIFLWEEGEKAVAMAGSTGPTPSGVRLNLVYTPPVHRGRGYASNLVAALSRHLLDTGRRFCSLYTDLTNPTSNKIYRAIGYEPLGESVVILFDGAGGLH